MADSPPDSSALGRALTTPGSITTETEVVDRKANVTDTNTAETEVINRQTNVADTSITEIETSSAVNRVLNLPELLENILNRVIIAMPPSRSSISYEEHLALEKDSLSSLTTVLRSQAVNRMFYHTIQNSPTLQRALWFRTSISIETNNTPEINPFFKHRILQSWLRVRWHTTGWDINHDHDGRFVEIIISGNLGAPQFKSQLQGSWRRMLMNKGQKYMRDVAWVRIDDVERSETRQRLFLDRKDPTRLGEVKDVVDVTMANVRKERETRKV